MSGTVYVVQRPAYYCNKRRGWVNKYDISSAYEHGELTFLLKPGNIYRDKLEGAIKHLHKMLETYGPGDHIMAIGDPIAIAAAVMVAAKKNNGKVSLLKFDRIEGRYDPFEIDIDLK